MADFLIGGESAIEIIPIHFDVPEHHILLQTFIETAAQAKAIIAAFNQHLFEGQLEYQILVLPPEVGSFKTKLGVAVAAGGILWSALESDIGTGFIKGLTGHEPAYWSELAGAYVGQLVAEQAKTLTQAAIDDRVKCQTNALIISEATKSFLQKDVSELKKNRRSPTAVS
ncbi:hypothetical protein [Mesorhizobium sp. M00.F.Ca.ET.216.01.1.1]|uniref:hypothetical protein n=1 Tax=Mesorhizobium sp. M00.F.Ca.ET.216.01.1.1 TaxID=2500528 RepID=UPI000FD71B28|nr:hypothetical protein [Mesorhizobium sp. M00.F.Ca.ET.216.01.1.1]TGQ31291.1 hypothetical protein EN859_030585 [Mesorhizobium sp. M00.F.Ca.ET.216.01.1.1]